ncbi:MAG: bifunctional phosphoglucose/phosphomannose isomerase [Actinomycetota bacterium]|nr:bifunctional phosphoglucose/phosphomannose isomerase [Actinomycetota bacterium]
MTDLDDVGALRAVDASDMLGTIGRLGADCRSAYDAARALDLPSAEGVTSVVVCGMGGSAMAGEVLRSVFRDRLVVPVEVSRGHVLPAYAASHTLVVGSSYSGNTSETVAAFGEAMSRGCRLLAVTGGGDLAHEATEAGAPIASLPAGYQPRAALGHLGLASVGALETMGLLPPMADDVDETVEELERLTGRMAPGVVSAENPAKQLATLIGDKVPVIWGAEGIGSVAATRWKTQMNENGKVPAFAAAMSELDHNEVVGWTRPYGSSFSLIAVRHDGEHPEIAARFALSYQIARDAGVEVEEVRAGGRSALARLFGLIIVGDFVSAYVGLRRGIDPTPVDVISRLKTALAGV